jgi:hypothetical protein
MNNVLIKLKYINGKDYQIPDKATGEIIGVALKCHNKSTGYYNLYLKLGASVVFPKTAYSNYTFWAVFHQFNKRQKYDGA